MKKLFPLTAKLGPLVFGVLGAKLVLQASPLSL